MDFSIVIPAFNEKERLSGFFLSLVDALSRINLEGEIIIVDDGSREEDHRSYLSLQDRHDVPVTILRHPKNLGKGAAIKTGFEAAKGDWIGFVDADGATPAGEAARLIGIAVPSRDFDGVFGSRILMLGYKIKRKFIRYLSGRIFTTLVYLFFRIPVYDPQCGCKFFRRSRILPLFGLLREKGYLFDIEMIALGHEKKLNFLEVPVSWEEVPGGKLHFFKDGLKMLIGLFRIKRRLANKTP